MEFDEYEYLEKTVENPELQRKEKTNGSDLTVKAEERDRSRSSKQEIKSSEKRDDVDRHSKKLKSGDDSHGYDSHKERGSSQHRSPSRDGDKEKDRHRSIHDNTGRVRDQDRDKRDRLREHDRDHRERDKRDQGSESKRERERDHSRRSRSLSERHRSDLDERDRERSHDRDYRDRERSRDKDYKERERERESREWDRDNRYGRAIFGRSFWQLGQAENLRSWVSKFLPSGMYLKACIAGLGGFGFFVTAMILSCYLFSSSLSTIALLHLFCCRMLVRE